MEVIQHIELGSAATTITFSSIPNTFTDLYLVVSARSSAGGGTKGLEIGFNGAFTNISNRVLAGSGSSASSFTSTQYLGQLSIPSDTANTFSSHAAYIPNYLSSTGKSYSADSVSENNGTAAWQIITAGLWSGTAAITQLAVRGEGATNLEAGSSATLYGIKNTTPEAKAIGGVVTIADGYAYHVFGSSGTFTPTQAITADVLIIAGGGGGFDPASGNVGSGAGGAGGVVYAASQSLTTTNYTVTVGAGGALATSGGNSSFTGLTTAVGGGRGGDGSAAATGGSGGGGGLSFPSGAAGTAGQGSAGGNLFTYSGFATGGGGGGATSVGGDGSGSSGGAGGSGTTTYSTWATATRTGVSGGYAGGGGGGAFSAVGGSPQGGTATHGGGSGGAAYGSTRIQGQDGVANTGGGGGGGGGNPASSLSRSGVGGSGIVIVRYAV